MFNLLFFVYGVISEISTETTAEEATCVADA